MINDKSMKGSPIGGQRISIKNKMKEIDTGIEEPIFTIESKSNLLNLFEMPNPEKIEVNPLKKGGLTPSISNKQTPMNV